MFSSELQARLDQLSPHQQRVIGQIVAVEAEGLPFSRVLKTVYSCRWCGKEVLNSNYDAVARKAALVIHEDNCLQKGNLWSFGVNETTYYKWVKEPLFSEVLQSARAEAIEFALQDSLNLLKLATIEAVRELLRQVTQGEKDADKARAAIALLDRASALTARKGKLEVEHEQKGKQNSKVLEMLNKLRGLAE